MAPSFLTRVVLAAAVASAFISPAPRLGGPRAAGGAPAVVPRAVPTDLVASHGDLLVAFADQGGNLAGKFFMGSLPPYALFLYFLNYEKNNAPPLVRFGFAYLLIFVAATIPTGIISKSTWGLSLADCDWLHGGAEALLTVTNVMLVLGFRGALKGDPEASDAEWARLGAAACAVAAAITIAAGVPIFHFGPHDALLGGAGALPGFAGEPANALSIPTWAVHFSSVCEFVLAMRLATRYAEATGNPRWNGVAWGMLPSHASGVCACTYHLFYNQAGLQWLVTLQAALTALGNTTLFIAALRLALSNGWTPKGALPSFAGGEPAADGGGGGYRLDSSALAVADDLTPGPLLVGEIVAFTLVGAYATKYGSLLAPDFLTSPQPLAAGLLVAGVPAAVAAAVLPKPDLGDLLPEGGLSYDDVKKYGVAGTIAYVLTELAFWAVAFPVAAAVFASANGHAPDVLNDGGDRAAVLAAVFAGANVARLAVPLRFGAALYLAPWVDENIVARVPALRPGDDSE